MGRFTFNFLDKQSGRKQKSGKFDEKGNELTKGQVKNYQGQVFSSQDEALNRNYSYGARESLFDDEKANAALAAQRKRQTLFGN